MISVGAAMPVDPDVMTIVSSLSRYWRRHPDACDTCEGIARWWIDAGSVPVPPQAVEVALAWMSACGVVETLVAADGRVRYRRACRGDELESRLAALSEDPMALLPSSGLPSQGPPQVH